MRTARTARSDSLVRVVAEGARGQAGHPAGRLRRRRIAIAEELVAHAGRPAVGRNPGRARRLRGARGGRPDSRGGDSGSKRAKRGSTRGRRRPHGASSCAFAAPSTNNRNRPAAAHHDFAQSASVFDLLGERYQAALSHLALGRLAAKAGNRVGRRALPRSGQHDRSRRSAPSATCAKSKRCATLAERGAARPARRLPADADDAVVRRLVDAAILPELLARETATALLETIEADAAVVFVAPPGGEVRVVAAAGMRRRRCAGAGARGARRATASTAGGIAADRAARARPRRPALAARSSRPAAHGQRRRRRLRMFAAVARQGFELCGARERPRAGRRADQRASARAAAPRLHLRQRRDEPGGRADPAPAGPRPDGAHHRRERNGQGSRRARDPRRLAPPRGDVSSPTTARRRRASWPTASCSATAAAASPAPSPTSRA